MKPKASQANIFFDNVIYCIWLICLIKTPMGCFAHFLGMVFMRWNRERFFMTCGVFEKEPLPTPGAFLCSGHGLAFAVGWFACGWFYMAPVGLRSTSRQIADEFERSSLRQLEQLATWRGDAPSEDGWIVETMMQVPGGLGFRLMARYAAFTEILSEYPKPLSASRLLALNEACVDLTIDEVRHQGANLFAA